MALQCVCRRARCGHVMRVGALDAHAPRPARTLHSAMPCHGMACHAVRCHAMMHDARLHAWTPGCRRHARGVGAGAGAAAAQRGQSHLTRCGLRCLRRVVVMCERRGLDLAPRGAARQASQRVWTVLRHRCWLAGYRPGALVWTYVHTCTCTCAHGSLSAERAHMLLWCGGGGTEHK